MKIQIVDVYISVFIFVFINNCPFTKMSQIEGPATTFLFVFIFCTLRIQSPFHL